MRIELLLSLNNSYSWINLGELEILLKFCQFLEGASFSGEYGKYDSRNIWSLATQSQYLAFVKHYIWQIPWRSFGEISQKWLYQILCCLLPWDKVTKLFKNTQTSRRAATQLLVNHCVLHSLDWSQDPKSPQKVQSKLSDCAPSDVGHSTRLGEILWSRRKF